MSNGARNWLRARRFERFTAPAVVACAAVIMGLPTLTGGFVGGDDHRLLLNHVLVNHPTFEHALKLFTISHRDLYQPLPLLSFSAEFALAKALGLFDKGEAGGAWLFHLTNILLHAINSVLVWMVIRRLHQGVVVTDHALSEKDLGKSSKGHATDSAILVATVAALLFAVHPLQTEVVAWTNGRMMLLSTLFALLSMLSFSSFMGRPRATGAILTVFFVLLSAISKVRIGLPILLIVVALARRAKISKRLLIVWSIGAVVTAVFVIVNVMATSGADLFSEAAQHLRGPRLVRVLLALAFYFQHVVWPVGLASYYPTPPVVHWSDPGTWRALFVMIATGVVLTLAVWRSRVARLGLLWFFATIAVTLPFFPARNILAADRYMYLPIIGLLWYVAALALAAHTRWLVGRFQRAARWSVYSLAVLILAACVGLCWHVAYFYATPLRKTQRIAQLFPTTPRVWEQLGWSHYRKGHYQTAIDCATKELQHDSPAVKSGAYQLLGMSQLRLGNTAAALRWLHKAMETDPNSALAKYRSAIAFDDLNRLADAIPLYEQAVQAAPLNNPTINRLASAYARVGRLADARHMYNQALANNPYDVTAAMKLAELNIHEATPTSYRSAQKRLEDLLGWMPENDAARTNLGVVLQALKKIAEAKKAYQQALATNPNNATAALNLAQLYYVARDRERAAPLFARAVSAGLRSVEQARTVHDFYMAQGQVQRCVKLWDRFVRRFPKSNEARAFAAWSTALAGEWDRSRKQSELILRSQAAHPLALAALAYVDLAQQRYPSAVERTDALCHTGKTGADARRRWLAALERFSESHPDIPWPYCLATHVLLIRKDWKAADLFVGLCAQRCRDQACRSEVESLKGQRAKNQSS